MSKSDTASSVRRGTSTQDPEDELELLGWFHNGLSRHATEALLLSNGKDGSYLLRKSHEGPNCYALSVRAKDSVKHFQVTRSGTTYTFGFNKFRSIKEFVSHFANEPLLGSETGTLVLLKCPYPREVEEPSIYESVHVHTVMQSGRTENDLVANAASLGTKEGYLIKQGAIIKTPSSTSSLCTDLYLCIGRKDECGRIIVPLFGGRRLCFTCLSDEQWIETFRVIQATFDQLVELVRVDMEPSPVHVRTPVPLQKRNWKTRWFTLNRNELKYFKDKMCAEPIRTLDLMECTGIQFDYSQEKVNCFCLVFPERTFYLCGKTGVEADEWIKILRWKLSQIEKSR